MSHSDEAQLQGNQVTWLGTAPPPKSNPRQVLVVLDEQPAEAVLAEWAKSRQEWAH